MDSRVQSLVVHFNHVVLFSAPDAPPQVIQLQVLTADSIFVKWKVNLLVLLWVTSLGLLFDTETFLTAFYSFSKRFLNIRSIRGILT